MYRHKKEGDLLPMEKDGIAAMAYRKSCRYYRLRFRGKQHQRSGPLLFVQQNSEKSKPPDLFEKSDGL